MKILEAILIIFILAICLVPAFDSNNTIIKRVFSHKNKRISELPSSRWDYDKFVDDITINEKSENIKSTISKLFSSTPPLKWILEEEPENLCLIAMQFYKSDSIINNESKKYEHAREFIKFMREPGVEILLTEAASRGYKPAMSMLASYYENADRFEEAAYWNKLGTAFCNPTSIMLRGMCFLIDGKQTNNQELTERGQKLIALSYLLGERAAAEIPGFENIKDIESSRDLNNDDIIDAVIDIEGNNSEQINSYIKEELLLILNKEEIQLSDLVNIIQKINERLDDPNVTVAEIHYLMELRTEISEDIIKYSKEHNEFYQLYIKAETAWKYRKIGYGSTFVIDVLLPMIFLN